MMLSRRQALAAGGLAALFPMVSSAAAERLVVAGGALTEIAVALGHARYLAGVDETSLYPPAVVAPLPKIGYLRTLSAEGILSLAPSLLLASDQAGPPAVLAQLRGAGVNVVTVPEIHAAEAVEGKIRTVAAALGDEAGGGRMAAAVRADLAAVDRMVADRKQTPRVLFIMSTSNGRVMAAGRDTAADLMLTRAGGRNVMAGYAGYKPATPEAILAADPDVVLLPQHSLMALGGMTGVASLPALAGTAAVRHKRIHALDMLYMLGLGPRIAHAVRDMAVMLHPGMALPALPPRSWT